MVLMAVSCDLDLFFSGHCQKHKAFRSRFPPIIVQSKQISLIKTKVSCLYGQGNALVSNLLNYEAVLCRARLGFAEEIAFIKPDQEIPILKALLLISAEDEAFVSYHRERDRLAVQCEGRDSSGSHAEARAADVDNFPLEGRTISTWLASFDFLAKEVEGVCVSKGGFSKAEVLKAVCTVLFEVQGFRRAASNFDTRSFYLHHVLTLRSGSGMLLCIIYMEVCRKLGVNIRAAEVGDELLLWPIVDGLQDFYEPCDARKSWLQELLAFHHPSHLFGSSSGPSAHGSFTSPTLKLLSNRDIVGMVLSKLKNIQWKDACKARPSFALTDPLHAHVNTNGILVDCTELPVGALLRPRSLRLALMASERLLLLHPHSWILRRDHGLLLYHSRRYGEAVQELSICTALAPTTEAQVLEHFVEKLHLLRIEASWGLRPSSTPSTLA